MTDLNFNQCFILLIIAFALCLIAIRCLMAVMNRGFLIVDYAKQQLMGEDGKGGKFGIKDLLGVAAQAAVPYVKQKVGEFLSGKTP